MSPYQQVEERRNSYKRVRGCAATADGFETGPQQGKVSNKKSKRTVHFSSNVSVRCFVVSYGNQGDASPPSPPRSLLWLSKDELDITKRRAATLAKLHIKGHLKKSFEKSTLRRLSLDSPPSNTIIAHDTVGDAARYEIKGESLRGMEHLTDSANGSRRRRVQDEAIIAALVEQEEQVCHGRIVAGAGSERIDALLNLERTRPPKLDSGKLARVYADKSREALLYALRVAEEDAKIAGEILSEDIVEPRSRSCTRDASSKMKFSGTLPKTSADFGTLPGSISCKLSRQLSLASVPS